MNDTKTRSKLWFVICVLCCCILGACLVGALILNIFTTFSLWWIYLCFIPISVISLIFSAYKLTEGKLALIILSVVSVILILALCLVSGFIKLADDHIDTVNSKIDFVNAVTGISLPPAPFDAFSDEQKIFDDENRQFVTVQSYGYYLPDKKLNGLLDDVVKNKNWISYEEDGELFKHFSPYVSYYDSVCLFYNVTEKTYNTLPAGDAPCEYIIVTLDPSYGSVNIYIFTV